MDTTTTNTHRAEWLADHDDPDAAHAWLTLAGPDENLTPDELQEQFEDQYLGEHRSPTAWAEEYANDVGFLDAIDNLAAQWGELGYRVQFDAAGYAYDCDCAGQTFAFTPWAADIIGHPYWDRTNDNDDCGPVYVFDTTTR